MANNGERSGLFKFFYVMLSIITFPIFAIVYILRHPILMLFMLLVMAGVLAYFPMRDGVGLSGAVDWYKKKYIDVKYAVVGKAAESGGVKFIPQGLLNEAKEIKADMDYKKEEESRVKSELYNEEIIRDKNFDNTAKKMKSRGGFKKKVEEVKEEMAIEDVSDVVKNTGSVGGLAGLVSKGALESEELENLEEKVEEVSQEVKDSVDEVKQEIEAIEQEVEANNDALKDNAEEITEDVKATLEEVENDANKVEDEFELDLGF